MVFFENLRIEIDGPSIAKGGMMMLTRLPSASRASTSGRELVDPPADPRHDLGRDIHDVLIVAERQVGQLELAAALDIDLLRTVDHDVGHGLVVHQRLDRAEPEHVRDQGLDEVALLGKVQLDLGLGEQLLDPAGELRLEGGARHLGRRGDVHMLEDERLDLRLRCLDHGAVGAPLRRGGIGLRLRLRCVQQLLGQRGHQVPPFERVRLHGVAQQVSLDRRIDNLGELAAAQQRAPFRPDLGFEADQQLLARGNEAVFARRKRRGLDLGGGERRCGRRREHGRGAARRQARDARVEPAVGLGPF